MRNTLKKLRDALRPVYGKGETEAIIRILFHYLKGWSTVDMIIHESESLSPFLKSEIDRILQRLLNHEPIQYITGEARFHGMTLKVTPDTLIPRPETDELVDIIIADWGEKSDLKVLDIATGSGCIAIALARSLRFPDVSAIDISSGAVMTAEENAKSMKVPVRFILHDIFSWQPPGQSYDIIVSNPPYIDESEKKDMEKNVVDHEPPSALFVPDDNPLIFYRHISGIASRSLSPGGILYLEINPRHSEDLRELLKSDGFGKTEILRDSFGKERFIKAARDEK